MSKKLKNVTTIIALCVGLILIGTKAYATTAKTLNDNTRLRKKASTNSEIVEIISKDEKVEVVSKEDDWYKVKYNSQVGYVRGDLIEVEEEKKEVAEEAKKEENKTEEASKAEETKTEETSKTEETQNQDETENQEEAKKEEESSKEQKVEIKENDQIELKNETPIQLLPIIFSCKTGKVPANTKITVVEVVGNWCHISAGNQEGWLHTSKIESSKAEEQKVEENKEEEKKEEKKLYVSTTTLNLREKADTKSDVVTQLSLNDEVTVVKVVNKTWTQVKFKDYEGYTASEYLSDKKVSDTTSRNAQELRNSEEEAAKKKAAEEAAKKKAEEAAKKKAAEEARKKQEEEEEE
ncbi:MAG: SH3 domain-containing protein, partial [Clostridia bacterium]|nr:SH3 domain-containing protein [Clostridia bacterium]